MERITITMTNSTRVNPDEIWRAFIGATLLHDKRLNYKQKKGGILGKDHTFILICEHIVNCEN
ncbi:hypothetical protein THOG10_180067 [Vibrio rotiferianus]|nr:hypothetical protein THOG10_180067 [Vibrio rotiferianus]